MNERTLSLCLPPLFESNAGVLNSNSVDIKPFVVGPVNCNQLRREVQGLPKLHFTSAQLLLCSFTLSDVDHSAHKFNKTAGPAQNRMTYNVNVSDGAIRMDNAVVRLPIGLIADSRPDQFHEAGLVAGMNPLIVLFLSGQTILWIETQNTIAFLRPVPDILLWTPCPATCVAEFLCLSQIDLALAHRFFRPSLVSDVSHRPHKLDVACSIPRRVGSHMDMLDRTAGQLQAMLKTKTFAVTRRSVDLLLHRLPIIGMNSREEKFQGRSYLRIAFKDSEGLVGPEVFGGGNVPPKTACVAEPLRLGKMCLDR